MASSALCRVFDETISASYIEGALDKNTIFYAQDALVIVAFVNDQLDADVLQLPSRLRVF